MASDLLVLEYGSGLYPKNIGSCQSRKFAHPMAILKNVSSPIHSSSYFGVEQGLHGSSGVLGAANTCALFVISLFGCCVFFGNVLLIRLCSVSATTHSIDIDERDSSVSYGEVLLPWWLRPCFQLEHRPSWA